MRTPLFALACAVAGVMFGCSGSQNAVTPADNSGSTHSDSPVSQSITDEIGDLRAAGDLVHGAIGIYSVDVDLTTMTARTELKARRDAAQSEIFNLEIGSFLRSDSFAIDAVSFTPSTVDLTYTTSHPFPGASDLSGTPSAANREDLAVTGRVLWLLDNPDAGTYFPGDGDVQANTGLVTNADGYFRPQGLVDTSGLTSNTFPYQLLVDESRDNRVGVSNGSSATGNYPGSTSWGVSEFSSGITGYGIWAQGQSSTNTISLDRPALSGGASFTADVAILVKYEDPRSGATGAEKRSNRLPSGDMSYRMPHAALDVSTIVNASESGGFSNGVASSSTISCNVRDWDAKATEAAQTNLSDETDTSLVSAGESGVPAVDVSIPGIALTSSTLAEVPGAETGAAGDELAYSGVINGTPSNGGGTYTGLIRAVDVVDITPPADFGINHFNLEAGGTLMPLGANFEGETYQSLDITVGSGGCNLPTGNWSLNTLTIFDGQTVSVTVDTVVLDPGSTTFDIEADWNDGGGFVNVASGLSGAGPHGPYISPNYSLADPGVSEMRTVAVRLVDSACLPANAASNVGGDTITINPAGPCADPILNGTQIFNADFESTTGDNNWTPGELFAPVLPNTDDSMWSRWQRCTASTGCGDAAGGDFVGSNWGTGHDHTPGNGCDFGEWDYDTNHDCNIVSAAIDLSSATSATLRFDSYKAGSATVTYRIYASTDGGTTWPTTLYTANDGTALLQNDITVDLAAVLGSSNVLLRFQSVDTPTGTFDDCSGDHPSAGWNLDNVEIFQCP